MEFINTRRRPTLLALLSLALLLGGGCASGGIFGGGDDDNGNDNGTYDDGRYDRNDDDRYDNDRVSEVRGRIDRVDTADRVIYVEASGVYRNGLRDNDDRLPIHYDDKTPVRYEGKTYEPRQLEEGDRVVVDVDDSGTRLYARDIEVTYDVTQGASDTYDRSADRSGDYDRDDDRYDRDDDRYDRSNRVSELRGRVRWVDEDRRIMELEDTSWGYGSGSNRSDRTSRNDNDVVEVYYDSSTVVEYNGKRYKPDSLERGDEVRLEVRDTGSRYETSEIQVVENVRD
jgi:hypothetical protein